MQLCLQPRSCVCSHAAVFRVMQLCLQSCSCVCSHAAVLAAMQLCLQSCSCVCSHPAVFTVMQLCLQSCNCVCSHAAVFTVMQLRLQSCGCVCRHSAVFAVMQLCLQSCSRVCSHAALFAVCSSVYSLQLCPLNVEVIKSVVFAELHFNKNPFPLPQVIVSWQHTDPSDSDVTVTDPNYLMFVSFYWHICLNSEHVMNIAKRTH
jgi:hypothetical protein